MTGVQTCALPISPSLTQLDRSGELLISTVDPASVYGTVLQQWLGTEPAGILGASYPALQLFAASAGAAIPPPPQGPSPGGELLAITPLRRLDTRLGMGSSKAPLAAGQTLEVLVAGAGDVPPTGVTAVILNVTAVRPTRVGYLTVWPTGEPLPLASNLNFVPGQIVPNLVICKVGTGGKVSIYNAAGSVEVVADVVGYVRDGVGQAVTPTLPARLVDTRVGGGAPLAPGASMDVAVVSAMIPSGGATAAVLNVTVVAPTAAGFLTVWPTGDPKPWASNLNFAPGVTVPNLVVAKLGTAGAGKNDRVSVFNSAGNSHVIVDLLGFVAPSSAVATPSAASPGQFVALTPKRVLDTRAAGGGGPLGAKEERTLNLSGQGGLPAATAMRGVVVNVTVTAPTSVGYLTVWPADQARPTASNLNFLAEQTVPNLVLCATSPDSTTGGRIKLFNFAGLTHVVVDVVGYIAR